MDTISVPILFCASAVAAPMCGVQETMGWEYSAAFCDGSVHFISETINVGTGWKGSGTPPFDIGVWGNLCAIADGQAIQLP